jgi:hypothetical protein
MHKKDSKQAIIDELYIYYNNAPCDMKSNMASAMDKKAFGNLPTEADTHTDGSIRRITEHRSIRKILIKCSTKTLVTFNYAYDTRRIPPEVIEASQNDQQIARLLILNYGADQIIKTVLRIAWAKYKCDTSTQKNLQNTLKTMLNTVKQEFNAALDEYMHYRDLYIEENFKPLRIVK